MNGNPQIPVNSVAVAILGETGRVVDQRESLLAKEIEERRLPHVGHSNQSDTELVFGEIKSDQFPHRILNGKESNQFKSVIVMRNHISIADYYNSSKKEINEASQKYELYKLE